MPKRNKTQANALWATSITGPHGRSSQHLSLTQARWLWGRCLCGSYKTQGLRRKSPMSDRSPTCGRAVWNSTRQRTSSPTEQKSGWCSQCCAQLHGAWHIWLTKSRQDAQATLSRRCR